MAMSAQGPEDHAKLAEDFPSPSAALHMDMTIELERQAAAEADAAGSNALGSVQPSPSPAPSSSHHHPGGPSRHHRPRTLTVNSFYTPTPQTRNNSDIPQSTQIAILREHFAKNPHPTKKELEELSRKTGREWRKIREYFRQRRNQGRGLGELEASAEPSRAKLWLHMSYRPTNQHTMVNQFDLYTAYKDRFTSTSPASIPLIPGCDLIQLITDEIPGTSAAQYKGEYVIRGLEKRWDGEEDGNDSGKGGERDTKKRKREYTKEEKEVRAAKKLEEMPEPVRASTWLIDQYQSADPNDSNPPIMQYDLYTSYITRFTLRHTHPTSEIAISAAASTGIIPSPPAAELVSTPLPDPAQPPDDTAIQPGSGLVAAQTADNSGIPANPTVMSGRLLTAVQLLDLVQMAFPGTNPAKDDEGNFVVKGLSKKESAEPSAEG